MSDRFLSSPAFTATSYRKVLSITLKGRLRSNSEDWETTIGHFKLNRVALRQQRKNTIRRRLRLLRKRIVLTEKERDNPLRAIPQVDAEWLLFLRIAEQLSWPLRSGVSRDPSASVRILENAARDDRFDSLLDEALEAMEREDAEAARRLEDSPVEEDGPNAAIVGRSQHDHAHPPIKGVTIRNYKSLEDIRFSLPKALPERERKRLEAQRANSKNPDDEGEIPEVPAC